MTWGFHFDHQLPTLAFTPPGVPSAPALAVDCGVPLVAVLVAALVLAEPEADVVPVEPVALLAVSAATKRSCPLPLPPAVLLILLASPPADVRLVRLEPGRREDADRRDPGRWDAESLLTRPIVPKSHRHLAD